MNNKQLEEIKQLLSTMNLKVAEIDKLERLAFQDVPILIAEIERLQNTSKHLNLEAQKYFEMLVEEQFKTSRYEETLKFYADDKNHESPIYDEYGQYNGSLVDQDAGYIANLALNPKED